MPVLNMSWLNSRVNHFGLHVVCELRVSLFKGRVFKAKMDDCEDGKKALASSVKKL